MLFKTKVINNENQATFKTMLLGEFVLKMISSETLKYKSGNTKKS